MTENMKKLLEVASSNEEFRNKLVSLSREDVIALAKEQGIALTDADFESHSEISDDELTNVAGGQTCVCVFGGGGTASEGQKNCLCVSVGFGYMKDQLIRCYCTLGGGGKNHAIE